MIIVAELIGALILIGFFGYGVYRYFEDQNKPQGD